MSKIILLRKGEQAEVSDHWFDYLNRWKWHADKDGYAVRDDRDKAGIYHEIRMHRLITNAKKGEEVDHINRNKLCNVVSNLRKCSHAQNHANISVTRINKTGFKGVFFRKNKSGTGKQWRSSINGIIDGKKKVSFIGCFYTKEEAARAYDTKAKEFFGEFACLNFPADSS